MNQYEYLRINVNRRKVLKDKNLIKKLWALSKYKIPEHYKSEFISGIKTVINMSRLYGHGGISILLNLNGWGYDISTTALRGNSMKVYSVKLKRSTYKKIQEILIKNKLKKEVEII